MWTHTNIHTQSRAEQNRAEQSKSLKQQIGIDAIDR